MSLLPSRAPISRLTSALKLNDAFAKNASQSDAIVGVVSKRALNAIVPTVGRRAAESLQCMVLHVAGVEAVMAARNSNRFMTCIASIPAGEIKAIVMSVSRLLQGDGGRECIYPQLIDVVVCDGCHCDCCSYHTQPLQPVSAWSVH